MVVVCDDVWGLLIQFPPSSPPLSQFPALPLCLLSPLPRFLLFCPSLPSGFMSQVTERSCALERAPCSKSSKYLSAVCVCCSFSTDTEDSLQNRDGVIFYSSSEMAELGFYVYESGKGKPARRQLDLPTAMSIPFEYISISVFLRLDATSIIQFWSKALLPRNIIMLLIGDLWYKLLYVDRILANWWEIVSISWYKN